MKFLTVHVKIPCQTSGVPCLSMWAITLSPVFFNSKFLPVQQYFPIIKYYHKHW